MACVQQAPSQAQARPLRPAPRAQQAAFRTTLVLDIVKLVSKVFFALLLVLFSLFLVQLACTIRRLVQ
jgi:hypothetical protein